jgi:hypothetical protein
LAQQSSWERENFLVSSKQPAPAGFALDFRWEEKSQTSNLTSKFDRLKISTQVDAIAQISDKFRTGLTHRR